MKVLIIGQAPSKRAAQDASPLVSKSGKCRLADIAGIPVEKFLDRVETRNIFATYQGSSGKRGDAFDMVAARAAAAEIPLEGRRVIFLGRKVARAFGHKGRIDYFEPLTGSPAMAAWCAPHPSGLNRWWNDAGHREAARMFLRAVVGA